MRTAELEQTMADLGQGLDTWVQERSERLPDPARTFVRRTANVQAELLRQSGRVLQVGFDVGRRLARVVRSGASEAVSAGTVLVEDSVRTVGSHTRQAADELGSEVRGTGTELRKIKTLVSTAGEAGAERVAEEVGEAKGATVLAGEGPTGAYETWTKQELYERAQELDVDGRSSMSKDELVEALRAN